MNPGSCIHFTGVQHKKCKLGYVYDELEKPLPCIRSYTKHWPKERRGQEEPCKHADCKDFTAPTAEQLTEDKRQHDESMKKFMVAYTGKVREWRDAQNWSPKNRVSATGKVPCESCGKGEIHLSMAAVNGHVWGKCTTVGCVSWME